MGVGNIEYKASFFLHQMKKTLPPPRAVDILFLKTTLHKGAIAFFNSSPHQETLCVNPIRSLG